MNKILVIGESSRDVFVYCDASRLCPDVPVPVLSIINQIENPGMASNVYRNIKSVVSDSEIITNKNWREITKTRYVHEKSNHMFLRVDSNDKFSRIDVKLINFNFKVIVISDYNKGFLHQEDIEYICLHHDCVFVDTKKVLGDWIRNAAYIKINDYEYKNSENFIQDSFRNKIIRTLGDGGCEFSGQRFPVKKVEVKDVSGAGDTFMAGLVIKFSETGNIIESIEFANQCASRIVTQRGVTTL